MSVEVLFDSAETRAGHTEYRLVIVYILDGHRKHLLKRYSEMRFLHKGLKALHQQLPAFPPRKLFGNLKAEFVQKRQLALQDYFRKVVKVLGVCQSKAFRDFLSDRKVEKFMNFDGKAGNNTDLDFENALGAALSGYS